MQPNPDANRNRMLMIGGGVVAALCLCACVGVFAIAIVPRLFNAAGGVLAGPNAPRAVAERFMQALRAGDGQAAYDLMSERQQADNDPDNLSDATNLESWTWTSTEVSGDDATVSGTLRFTDDETDTNFDLLLVRENGEWRVDDISFDE